MTKHPNKTRERKTAHYFAQNPQNAPDELASEIASRKLIRRWKDKRLGYSRKEKAKPLEIEGDKQSFLTVAQFEHRQILADVVLTFL